MAASKKLLSFLEMNPESNLAFATSLKNKLITLPHLKQPVGIVFPNNHLKLAHPQEKTVGPETNRQPILFLTLKPGEINHCFHLFPLHKNLFSILISGNSEYIG